ncbi:FAD-dependent oxidoreductase [Bacillus kwashiorkori]|uniref:FAD-dependent oxidoreductase n=1 Tax=Bacillus kwashiorkori TaxID=1522318 RepID=UPI000784CDDE|nr:FAD-dependent oxidoreductase [Bacillus kwashiorkori]
MGFIKDIAPIFKKSEITFLKCNQEGNQLYTFLFEKPVNLDYKAGQHGVFTIIHKKIKKPSRPFSVATAAFEEHVKISMEIPEKCSEFKQALLQLKPGMKIQMRGPFGPLYLNEEKPAVLIAGGIGITPFRAMMKAAENNPSINQPITLYYLDSRENYLYKEELDEIKHPLITVNYMSKKDSLYDKLDEYITKQKNDSIYYVAGPQKMVKSVQNHLKANNISKSNIKKDIFFGY